MDGPTRISCRAREFPALKNQWLNQVMADNDLPGKADKLARYLVEDCGMTLHKNKGGEAYSFRGQASLAELLGVSERYIRKLLSSMVERGHIAVEIGGRAHTNRIFLTMFRRNNSSAYVDDVGGPNSALRRNKHDQLGGTYGPPSSVIGILGAALQADPIGISNSKTQSVTRRRDDIRSGDARSSAVPPSIRVDDEISIPGLGECWVDKIVSKRPFHFLVYARDGEGLCRAYRVDLQRRYHEISISEAEVLPDLSGEIHDKPA